MNLNGNLYYYERNAQNDIVGLIDTNMNEVVTYSYDSWGKLLNIGGSLAGTVGLINPFRYRGYYYDTETGLYYLLSRYYDPNIGRFLNADGAVSTGVGLLGYNMFAYCNNNPVNMSDQNGDSPLPACIANAMQAWDVATGQHTLETYLEANLEKGVLLSEHTKNKTPSNQQKHEEGQRRKLMDKKGEKGDSKRQDRSNKRHQDITKQQIDWNRVAGAAMIVVSVVAIVVIAADDVTGVGVADEVAIAPLAGIVWDGVLMVAV